MPARKPASPKAEAKPRKLTSQRENFARLVVRGHSQAAAYRLAYIVGDGTRPSTVWNEAWRLASNPDVAHRIAELTAEAARRAGVTKESMLHEMAQNRDLALDAGELSVAATSSRDRAKVGGLLTDKLELGGKDGAAIQVQTELSADERSVNDIARRIAFALAKGKRRAGAAKEKPEA